MKPGDQVYVFSDVEGWFDCELFAFSETGLSVLYMDAVKFFPWEDVKVLDRLQP